MCRFRCRQPWNHVNVAGCFILRGKHAPCQLRITALCLPQESNARTRFAFSPLVFLQLALGGVLVAALVAGILGVAVNKARLGHKCDWCATVSCVDTKYWNCVVADAVDGGCSVTVSTNGTNELVCPTVRGLQALA